MKPESAAYLDKARAFLDQAETMLRVYLIEAAGRTAYLAAFHTAQAFIFETTGRIYKRHATVQSEFARLTRNDMRVADELRAFLPRAISSKRLPTMKPGPVRTYPSKPRVTRLLPRAASSNASPA